MTDRERLDAGRRDGALTVTLTPCSSSEELTKLRTEIARLMVQRDRARALASASRAIAQEYCRDIVSGRAHKASTDIWRWADACQQSTPETWEP